MKKENLILTLLLSSLIALVSCSRKLPSPNIVLLVAEDISPALGCYGDTLATTPNLDKLASGSLVFTNAWAVAPICAPSRSALISGIYPTSLGTQHLRSDVKVPSQLKMLPELLRAQGYYTTNRDKTDYNFSADGLFDHWSSTITPWRNRSPKQPFFSFINVGPSHEGTVNNSENYQKLSASLNDKLLHDPEKVVLPPYYPDSKKTREVWAHYYDMVTLMDQNVGQILDSLEKDGLKEETIIIFISDHGFGMPRYKRWLNKTGMHVPFILSIPEKYKSWAGLEHLTGKIDDLFSFIDLTPTILSLAGVEIPDYYEGSPILGPKSRTKDKRKFAFGARDRADDMIEMSRSITDGDFIYIRHFMPHLPYIQPGYIFSDEKVAFKVLRELKNAGLANEEQMKLWNAKPNEELYDLKNDPFETNNLANSPEFDQIKNNLKKTLHSWMLKHRDLGLLPEPEYMIRSAKSSPYTYGKSKEFAVEKILLAAEKVGFSTEQDFRSDLQNKESGVRYWAVMGIRQADTISEETARLLQSLLKDESASVQIAAAEALSHFNYPKGTIEVLEKWLQDPRPWLSLMAARNLLLLGDNAKPAIPVMYEVLKQNLAEPGTQGKYKDPDFATFTGWALAWALQQMGEPVKIN